MLPSAAAFVDPLFSTGFPLTLLGIERLARLLERGLFLDAPEDEARSGLAAYANATAAEADHTARFVAGCYASFRRFDAFAAYSMFYFAAASFAEASRRLTPERRGFGFLGTANPAFASALVRLSPAVRAAEPSGCLARARARCDRAAEHRRTLPSGKGELVRRGQRRSGGGCAEAGCVGERGSRDAGASRHRLTDQF